MSNAHRTFALVTWLLCIPSWGAAQGTAGISGTVKDSTGLVLPGVTVEVSSPALIEKTRVVLSDGAGQYQVISLPPGVYTVNFSLTGFNAFKREGIDLTTGFTATVNAELKVGTVEETITISGASPVIDVQNVKRQVVMTRDIVDALPTGKAPVEMATLIPGVQMVNGNSAATGMGGSAGMDQFATLTAHGSRTGDTKLEVNGMNVNVFAIRMDSTYINFQDGNVQEYAFEVSGQSAESESGGVRVNLIPKEGGNSFHGSMFANFTNGSLQSDNMTDELRARGLRDPDTTKSLWTANPSFGGPLVQDKLWFYGGYSRMVNRRYKAGMYADTTPGAWRPTYDLTKQVVAGDETHDGNIRITLQAASKHKLSAYYDFNKLCQCPYLIGATYTGINTQEGSFLSPRKTHLVQLNWTAPVTSRLLLEASGGSAHFARPIDHYPTVVTSRMVEATTGVGSRAPDTGSQFNDKNTNNQLRGSISYVTGTHAAKFGTMYQFGIAEQEYFVYPENLTFATLNYRPTSVTYWATPFYPRANQKMLGVFAQDQWRLTRLTLNLGLRYDYYNQGYPDEHLPATRYVPTARDFPAANLLSYKDLSPRLGAAYDIFGTGKTAVKASLSRFILQQTLLTTAVNPARANNSMTRSWTDPNGDFIIQGDPFDPAANGELGPSQNLNFGKAIINNNYDPAFASGFSVRPFNWEGSVSLQHELLPRVSVTAAYFRRWFGNFQVTDNLLVGPADYDTYCVTAPVDPRLPGGGGEQICGLYDLKPTKVGQSNNKVTSSVNFGKQFEHWNGGDLAVQARLPRGLILTGGVSTGKTTTDSCDVAPKIDSPSSRFCHQESPFLTQVKFGGAFTLPWAIQVSGTLQSFQGPNITASATFTNAQIIPSLGRPLSAGTTATVALIEPNTIYSDRLTQVDLRFAKTMRFGGKSLKGMIDIFNAMNINTVTLLNNTYGTTGSSWLVPTGISLARLIKIGAQFDF